MTEHQEQTDTRTQSRRPFSEKLNSRKLALTASSILIGTLLLVNGYITGNNWINLVEILAGAYMATQAYVDVRGNKNS